MKRYVLLLGVLLYCIMLKAQSVSYSCRYWFDQNHAQAVTMPFNNSIWQTELDVGMLSEGFHMFHLQVADTAMNWSSPMTYMFFKASGILHENLTCHYWFDQDHEQIQHLPFGNGHLFLDVSGLEDGIHTVNVLLEGENITTTQNYSFVKVAIEDPSTECQYHCWFDNDYSTMQTGSIGTGIFELEVEGLSNGIHTVYVQIDNGTLSVPQCYMFYKRPVGGYIAKWEYWLNGNTNNRHTSNLSPCTDSLSIITLLPMETQPIRSSCFHFQPNGDEPYINAKNEITLRFWDALGHFIDKSSFYIDDQVQQSVVADIIERNATETIAVPGDNQIQWFKLDAGRGDYLSFKADKACTMQLFAPSGEEVYSASGSESIQEIGFNVWEDGTYYLAVHDVTGSGEMVSITYNWLNRYAIVSYDVHLVGNGGCSTITFQGNGFNSLLDAYLVNYQNDTIKQLDIGHESNTKTTISFNFYQENLGAYDAVFEFFEETIRINGALEVQEPVDILLTSTVSYPSQFLRNTPCTYTYTITNNGNMSAYAVPIFVYVSSKTEEGISHLEFDGLDLPSLIDSLEMDSLSAYDKVLLQEWADEIAEDHYFLRFHAIDEETGDTIFVRSNYFFMNMAPFESKILSLIITANEPIDVWVTIPNEVVSPITFMNNRSVDGFCCVADKISCIASISCTALDIWSIFAGPMVGIASCVCDGLNQVLGTAITTLCDPENLDDFWVQWRMLSIGRSFVSSVLNCAIKESLGVLNVYMNINKYKEIIEEICKALSALSLMDSPLILKECIQAFTEPRPNCPPGDSQGGKSDAANALDPNDIYGYLSESGSHYMRQEIQNVQYEIEFENDTALATAAAHTIIVRDTLNRSRFDLNSLAARSVTIGDKRLDLNGEQTFARTLDLRPELYVIAQVNQDYDPTTGVIQWTIQSLDPMTMEPTDDPNQGVLPVNYYGDGVGFIDYSIDIKEAFADGTEISNRAGIIFDQEEVIMTPTWTNIIDAVKPTSHIVEVTPFADSLNFSFVSEDNRSGVWYHTLYYRNDSTQMEWQVKKPQITENSLMLYFDDFQTTEYLVMATDSAGNHEEKEMVTEYIYYYEGPGAATQTDDLSAGWNWWSTYIELRNVDGLAMLEEAVGDNSESINSQTAFTMYYGEYGWYGSLSSINNESMYRLKMSNPTTISMTGIKANPLAHPITLTKGWNYIGFLSSEPLEVEDAFVELQAAPGDIVKNHSKYAQYYDGYGWYGSLTSNGVINPGDGMMYKSVADESKTFTYPANPTRSNRQKVDLEGTRWTYNAHAYPSNMTMLAVVEIDGVEVNSDNYELAVFAADGCRGSIRLLYVEPMDRYVAFLTVAGEEPVGLEFRLYNTVTSEEYFGGQNLAFSPDAVTGSFTEPFVVRFNSTGVDENAYGLSLYPNPAHDKLVVECCKPICSCEVYSIVGQLVCSQGNNSNHLEIKVQDLPSGSYLIRVVTDSFVETRRFVKD